MFFLTESLKLLSLDIVKYMIHKAVCCALFICPLKAYGPFLRQEKYRDGLVSLTETLLTL